MPAAAAALVLLALAVPGAAVRSRRSPASRIPVREQPEQVREARARRPARLHPRRDRALPPARSRSDLEGCFGSNAECARKLHRRADDVPAQPEPPATRAASSRAGATRRSRTRAVPEEAGPERLPGRRPRVKALKCKQQCHGAGAQPKIQRVPRVPSTTASRCASVPPAPNERHDRRLRRLRRRAPRRRHRPRGGQRLRRDGRPLRLDRALRAVGGDPRKIQDGARPPRARGRGRARAHQRPKLEEYGALALRRAAHGARCDEQAQSCHRRDAHLRRARATSSRSATARRARLRRRAGALREHAAPPAARARFRPLRAHGLRSSTATSRSSTRSRRTLETLEEAIFDGTRRRATVDRADLRLQARRHQRSSARSRR